MLELTDRLHLHPRSNRWIVFYVYTIQHAANNRFQYLCMDDAWDNEKVIIFGKEYKLLLTARLEAVQQDLQPAIATYIRKWLPVHQSNQRCGPHTSIRHDR